MNIIERIKNIPFIYKAGCWINIIIYNYIIGSFDLLKVKLRLMNVLHPKKFNKLSSYHNKYLGKRAFIIATGPSLTMEDVNRLSGEYTFCVNAIVKLLDKMSYKPTFLGIQDASVYSKIGNLIESSALERVLVSDSLFKKVKNKEDERFIQFPFYSCTGTHHGEMLKFWTKFSPDASKVVYGGNSIVYSLLQIAVYMGFTEIYLLGCDCSYNKDKTKQYFVESGHYDKNACTAGNRMIMAFSTAKDYLDKHCPNVKVFNSTRGGMLEVFPRKTLDELFN